MIGRQPLDINTHSIIDRAIFFPHQHFFIHIFHIQRQERCGRDADTRMCASYSGEIFLHIPRASMQYLLNTMHPLQKVQAYIVTSNIPSVSL